MQDRHVINDSYYCGRVRQDGIISVLTANSYVVAEYDERTGNIRWPRVVNASQKESLHNWLLKNFPVISVPVVEESVKAVAQPAKQAIQPVKRGAKSAAKRATTTRQPAKRAVQTAKQSTKTKVAKTLSAGA